MKIEIGDKVRFLNDVGGGTITRIEGKLAFVEDNDGFEIPVPVYEAVVVEKASVETVKNSILAEQKSEISNIDIVENEPELEIFDDETHDDSDPKIFLAFITPSVVIDNKSRLNAYLVNDSNYFYTFLISEINDGLANLLFQGIINPNTKLLLTEKTVESFNKEWFIQLTLYKQTKAYMPFQPVSTSICFTPNRFLKPNAFEGNDFFFQSAHLISLMKNELEKKMELLTDTDTQKIILEKETKERPKRAEKRTDTKELLEIDLHIHELLDDVRGLSNAEMLKIQIDKFNQVMKENKPNKGKKVVFIHGIGNGTLKTELRKQLEQNYKGIYYLDASFKEYGFGATMVIM